MHKLNSDCTARSLNADDFNMLLQYNWHPLVVERDTIYLLIAAMHGSVSLVVLDAHSKPIAMLLAMAAADGQSAFILKLHVALEMRGRGIATAMIKIFEKNARELGIKSVFLLSSGSKKQLYIKSGYELKSPHLPRYMHRYIKEEKSCDVLFKDLSMTLLKTRKDAPFREKMIDFIGVDT